LLFHLGQDKRNIVSVLIGDGLAVLIEQTGGNGKRVILILGLVNSGVFVVLALGYRKVGGSAANAYMANGTSSLVLGLPILKLE
jgi:hypothetical protein